MDTVFSVIGAITGLVSLIGLVYQLGYRNAVRNGVYKPTSITIDNTLGAADRIINVRDTFTPSVSNAVPVPVAQNINRLQVTCLIGEILNLGEPDLAGVKCLGSLGIIANAVDAACFISVGYKTE